MTAPAGKPERTFGYSVGAACLALAALLAWRKHLVLGGGLLAGVGGLLVVLAALRPAWLSVPRAGWERVGHALGWINSRIILLVFFVLVVTPVGLAKRLAGWDPFRRRKPCATGWVSSPERHRDPRHYERMY